MSVIVYFYGTYHFAAKPVGFRPDVCLQCNRDTVSVEHRAFDAWHLFFVPLVPLGFRRHWRCSQCGKNPRPVKTRRAAKMVGIPLFLLVGLVTWMTPPPADADPAVSWGVRLAGPILALWCGWSWRRDKAADPVFRARLRRVPSVSEACPVCAEPLSAKAPRKCGACGVEERRAPELATA